MTKQSLKVKEHWRHWTPELAKIFLRSGPEGKTHPVPHEGPQLA